MVLLLTNREKASLGLVALGFLTIIFNGKHPF